MRPLPFQLVEPLAIEGVIAIAEQDQPIGPVAVLIADVPVILHFLERDQQIEPAIRAGARDRSEHGEEKRIDHALVGRGIFEEEQRDRVRALRSQRASILVDSIIEFGGDRFDPGAGLRADRFVAAQRPADRGLRHARTVGDVEARRPPARRASHASLPIARQDCENDGFPRFPQALDTLGRRGDSGNARREIARGNRATSVPVCIASHTYAVFRSARNQAYP